MGQVYTCPSCAKKIEDGQDWSLVWKQGDVEIRAHAEGCGSPDGRAVTSSVSPRAASLTLLLGCTSGDQLDPRLRVEVILIDIALFAQGEEGVVRCTDLDELRHS